jgi:hypothetical protein
MPVDLYIHPYKLNLILQLSPCKELNYHAIMAIEIVWIYNFAPSCFHISQMVNHLLQASLEKVQQTSDWH